MDPHKQMGRTLAKARADLDDINRRGQGDMTPVTRKLTEDELRTIMPDPPQPWIEPKPEPVWPLLVTVAVAVVLALAIGRGVHSLWLGGM